MGLIILNILIALGLLFLGSYITAWCIAEIIITKTEGELLGIIRELKNKAGDLNDY